MHAGYGHRTRALCAPLPQQSKGKLEAVGAGTLHGGVDPFGEPRHPGSAPTGEGAGLCLSALHPQPLAFVPGGQARIGLEKPPLVKGSFLESNVNLVLLARVLFETPGTLPVEKTEVDGLGELAVFLTDTSVGKALGRAQLLLIVFAYPISPQVLLMPALTLLPIAVGIAILKYHLYDIDLIINRTLVYGSLTAILAGLYFGGVTATEAIFRSLTGQDKQPQLAVVVSTLVIAALFNPLRRRVQSFIDRRFYRSKYDARKTLEAFSTQLRNETDLDALSADLVGVVRETMQPAHVSLWLKPESAQKVKQP